MTENKNDIVAQLRQAVNEHNESQCKALIELLAVEDPDNIEGLIETIAYDEDFISEMYIGDAIDRIHQLAPHSAADLYAQAINTGFNDVSAIALLTQAIQMQPDFERVLFSRGRIHYFQHNYGMAIDDMEAALRITPNHAQAMYFAGMASYESKKYAKAAKHLMAYVHFPGFSDRYRVLKALAECFEKLAEHQLEQYRLERIEQMTENDR